MYIDRERWAAEAQRPDWYLRLRDEYEGLLARARASPREVARAIADDVYSFFENVLDQGTIALGTSGPAWDSERAPIDTAVIHHTKLTPGISWRRIDAIHLTRIYARYYAHPAPAEIAIRGTPIYSGHFRATRQVFYGYHWLVRGDGSCERLLNDHETGWQAGDWSVNCRSLGICLDGDFEREAPSPQASEAIATLIRRYGIDATRILGHREINPRTSCPGSSFLSDWKSKIVAQVSQSPPPTPAGERDTTAP